MKAFPILLIALMLFTTSVFAEEQVIVPSYVDKAKIEAVQKYNRGIDAIEAENYKLAALLFQDAVNLKPNYAKAYFQLGYSYSSLGDDTKALNAYKKALALNNDLELAHFNLALLLTDEAGGKNAAIEHFLEALRINPDNDYARHNIWKLYIADSEFSEAVTVYEDTLNDNPYDPYNNWQVGYTYWLMKEYKTALSYMFAAINPFTPRKK